MMATNAEALVRKQASCMRLPQEMGRRQTLSVCASS